MPDLQSHSKGTAQEKAHDHIFALHTDTGVSSSIYYNSPTRKINLRITTQGIAHIAINILG